MRSIAAALALVLATPVLAQSQPTTPAAKVTYIQAGQLLARPGQPARGPSTIIVRDGKITVTYSVKDDALVAFDRTKPGHPMLWALPVDLPIVSGGKLLITGPQHLGILGAGNDLRLFTRDN